MRTLTQPVFSYPNNDEDPYLSWYKDEFSSVFVATNPFLNIPQFPLNSKGEWISDEVNKVAKQRGAGAGISWKKISELCGFPSIAHVNRALSLTGSKRVAEKFSCPADTATMLKLCREQNIFTPDEGFLSPLSELSLAGFLKELGHDEVVVADHFGTSPRPMNSERFSLPEVSATPEIYARDKSIYVSIYTDYHYFLICQTDASRSDANPANFFEGFFADEDTNDFWGVGDLS